MVICQQFLCDNFYIRISKKSNSAPSHIKEDIEMLADVVYEVDAGNITKVAQKENFVLKKMMNGKRTRI